MKNAQIKQKETGFTLIEILVVITIIGILSGLLFTGASGAMNSAKKASAENTAYNLRNAIGAYFTEYRRQPLPSAPGNSAYVDYPSDKEFMDILLAADSSIGREKNPRGIPFFSGKAAKKLDSSRWIKGLALQSDGGGSLWDPYGRMYGIRLDTSNKGRMENPAKKIPNVSGGEGAPNWGSGGATGSSVPDLITESVVVWSSGKEEDLATDNVTTW